MKIKPLHIGILGAISVALFFIGFATQPYIQGLFLLKYEGIEYVTYDISTMGRQAMLFGLALALFPLLSFTGWSLTKLQDAKQKQTFVGVQLIILSVTLLFWYLRLKDQLNALKGSTEEVEGIILKVTVPIERMQFAQHILGGVLIGFMVALLLSGRIKKRSEVSTKKK